jgi:hypothetical protein
MENYYYQELDWKSDFSHTGPTFKKWCNEEYGNYRYFQIHVDRICDEFEIYKNLRDTLLKHDIILFKCKFMQMDPGSFMKIHIDQGIPGIPGDRLEYYNHSASMSFTKIASPIEVALNIPLRNAGDHITRWYTSEGCNVFLDPAACGPLPTLNGADWPDKDELISSHGVASLKMSKPTLIRTNSLHNVDARHSNQPRWILSCRIVDKHTKDFISWNELQRVHNIQF